MSYSQGDEERWILKHTPQEGRFLDIGAWQAKQFSARIGRMSRLYSSRSAAEAVPVITTAPRQPHSHNRSEPTGRANLRRTREGGSV